MITPRTSSALELSQLMAIALPLTTNCLAFTYAMMQRAAMSPPATAEWTEDTARCRNHANLLCFLDEAAANAQEGFWF